MTRAVSARRPKAVVPSTDTTAAELLEAISRAQKASDEKVHRLLMARALKLFPRDHNVNGAHLRDAAARLPAPAAIRLLKRYIRAWPDSAGFWAFRVISDLYRNSSPIDRSGADLFLHRIANTPYVESGKFYGQIQMVLMFAYRAIGSADPSVRSDAIARIQEALGHIDRLLFSESIGITSDKDHLFYSLQITLWHLHIDNQDLSSAVEVLENVVKASVKRRSEKYFFQANYNMIRSCVMLGYIRMSQKQWTSAKRAFDAAFDLFLAAGRVMRVHFVMLGEFSRTLALIRHASKLNSHVERALEGKPVKFVPKADNDAAIVEHCFRQDNVRLYDVLVRLMVGQSVPDES